MRTYMNAAEHAVDGVPGGPRGYQVLSAAAQGEPRSQLALAQYRGVDRTVMTYLLDDLETAGLVERRPDPADRRARRVVITDVGLTRLYELEQRLRMAEEHVLGPLQPAERDTLRHLLRQLATQSGTRVNPCTVAEELREQDTTAARPGR